MYFKPLILPLLAQVALAFIVMSAMYRNRINEMKKRRISPQRLDTHTNALNTLQDSARSADNFSNQFEAPVLFYTAILLTLILMLQDPIIVTLAWVYVALRYAHSFIHITYNRVLHRFWVYMLSSVVLLGIWIRLGSIVIQS
jgi:hypothetical protein